MSVTASLIIAAVAWLGLVLLARWIGLHWLSRGPGGNPVTGLLWHAVRVYCRLLHRPRYAGLVHVPRTNRPGGLIVVANHTSPIDPLLIQAACSFEIRWMMAGDMMVPQLDWFWRRMGIIGVARDGTDLGPAREAIRHVRGGGVIGMFPEGGLVRPSGAIRPFHNGVGLIVARSRAPVLLVWISGTPEAPEMGRALVSPSRARVQFIDRLTFDKSAAAADVAGMLRRRLAEASGWPRDDEPLIPTQRSPDPFAVA